MSEDAEKLRQKIDFLLEMGEKIGFFTKEETKVSRKERDLVEKMTSLSTNIKVIKNNENLKKLLNLYIQIEKLLDMFANEIKEEE